MPTDSGGADRSPRALTNPSRNLTFQEGQESTRRDARPRPDPGQQGGCSPGMKARFVGTRCRWAPVREQLLRIPIQSVNFLIQTWPSPTADTAGCYVRPLSAGGVSSEARWRQQ